MKIKRQPNLGDDTAILAGRSVRAAPRKLHITVIQC
jgi:hypothetical protein